MRLNNLHISDDGFIIYKISPEYHFYTYHQVGGIVISEGDKVLMSGGAKLPFVSESRLLFNNFELEMGKDYSNEYQIGIRKVGAYGETKRIIQILGGVLKYFKLPTLKIEARIT